MRSLLQFDVDADGDGAGSVEEFQARAQAALIVLAACPGFRGGRAGRSIDEPSRWIITTEWRDVGSYRRALGRYEVKLQATPFLATALNAPSAFEDLVDVTPAPDGSAPIVELRATDLIEVSERRG